MSILIKGMEMPKNGWKHILLTSDGKAYRFEDFSADNTATRFEAVEVPPHGRLIDADELEYHADNVRDPMGRTEKTVMWEKIKAAPIVIPADKDGET